MLWLNKSLPLLLVMLACLAGCGFQPIYGDTKDRHIEVSTYLASIKIEPIRGPLGQKLYNALEDRFSPNAETSLYGKAFVLEASVKSKRDAVVVEQDGSISRYNINLTSGFRLYDGETRELLHKGSIRRIASFNVAEEKFAAYVAERDAVERALHEISEDYVVRLAAYFAQHYKLTAGNGR